MFSSGEALLPENVPCSGKKEDEEDDLAAEVLVLPPSTSPPPSLPTRSNIKNASDDHQEHRAKTGNNDERLENERSFCSSSAQSLMEDNYYRRYPRPQHQQQQHYYPQHSSPEKTNKNKHQQHYSSCSAPLPFPDPPHHYTPAQPLSYYHQTLSTRSTPSSFTSSSWETAERRQKHYHYHNDDYRRGIYPSRPPSPPAPRPRTSYFGNEQGGTAADERNHEEGIYPWPPSTRSITSFNSYDGKVDEERNRQQDQLKIKYDDMDVYTSTQPATSTSWNASHKYACSQLSHDKANQSYKQDHNANASLTPIKSTFANSQPPSQKKLYDGPLAVHDWCPQLPRSNRHQNACTGATYESEDHKTSTISFSPMVLVYPNKEVEGVSCFPVWGGDNQEEISILPDNVSKKRKIGRQEECEFSRNSKSGTVFAAPSTTPLRSMQSRNISSSTIEDEISEEKGMPNETKKKAQRTHCHEVRGPASTADKDISDIITNAPKETKSGQRKEHHVKDERSTLTFASTIANDEYGFRNLLALSDCQLGTSFTIEVFHELEIVFFEESDRRNNRTHLSNGFAGFTCRHCKVPAGKGGRYFPSTMKTLNDAQKTLLAVHKHLVKCKSCPDDVKTNLNRLLTEQHHSEKLMLNKKKSGQRPFFEKIWDILRSKDDI